MPTYASREHDFFEVAAFADEVFDSVTMRDTDDVLLDDRAIVENIGDVVARSSDQLDAALEGLMVWARSDEGGKKRMMSPWREPP